MLFELQMRLASTLILLSLFASPAFATRLFHSNYLTQPFAFGSPRLPLVADIDGDGIPDLFVMIDTCRDQGPCPHSIGVDGRVAFGLGDGTFRPDFASNMPDSSTNWGTLLVDLNRDGRADFVELQPDSGVSLKVCSGLGDGTFGPGVFPGIPTDGVPFPYLAAGDLDGDGWTDVLAMSGRSYAVWRNHGDGGLEAPVTHPMAIVRPSLTSFQLVDVNDDGKLDLVGTQTQPDGADRIAVALGHGDGTLEPPIVSAVGIPYVCGDLDGDGHVDVVVATPPIFTTAAICFGDGTGSFGAGLDIPREYVVWDGIADLNGNGQQKAVGYDFQSDRASVLSVNPDRTLKPFEFFEASRIDEGWYGLIDLDGNGLPDIVGTQFRPGDHVVTSPSSGLQTALEFPAGPVPTGLAVGDFDRDGNLDVVTASPPLGKVSVLLGGGMGSLGPYNVFAAGSRPVALAQADLDGDGDLDLAVADSSGNAAQVLLGNGDGTFAPPVPLASGSGPNGIVVADFNHDGHPDIATANLNAASVSVLLGQGGGLFGIHSDTPVPGPPVKLAAGDLDGDGNLDLVAIGGVSTSSICVLRGDGSGGFSSIAHVPVLQSSYLDDLISSSIPRDVAVADVNSDGKQDVVAVTPGLVVTLLGNGNGTFSTQTGGAVSGAFGVAVGDLDEDAKPDVVTAADLIGHIEPPYSGGAAFLRGHGDGSFDSWVAYGTHGTPDDVAIGDFDGDGLPDLVVADLTASTVSVLLHEKNGSVPALASIVSAEGSIDRVRLLWQGAPYVAATLYRRSGTEAWSVVAPVVADASGRIFYEDDDVKAGQSYSYRLGAGQGASEVFFGDVTVRTPSGASLALGGAAPNPAHGVWSVTFSLPGTGPARLEVIDLAGRIVAAREVGRFGEGSHVLALPETGSLPTGVYFLRLTRAAMTQLAKVCAIR